MIFSSKYQVVSSRYQVASSRYQVVSSRYQVVSSRYQVVSSRYQVVSSRYQVASKKYQVTSIRYQVVIGLFVLLLSCRLSAQTEVSENLFRFFELKDSSVLFFEQAKSAVTSDPERFLILSSAPELLKFYERSGPYAHKLQPDSLLHELHRHKGCDSLCMYSGRLEYYYADQEKAFHELDKIIALLGLPSVQQFRKELQASPALRKKDKKRLLKGYIYKREVFVLADPEHSENLYWKHEVKVTLDPFSGKGFSAVIKLEME